MNQTMKNPKSASKSDLQDQDNEAFLNYLNQINNKKKSLLSNSAKSAKNPKKADHQ